jgi:hypothetical protein
VTSNSLPDSVLSNDMWLLQLNIEAAVRSSKERDSKRSAFYANTCAATWAAHRAFRLLVEIDPERAAALVDELEEELGDGEYMETASERAEQAGVDVDGLADEIRSSLIAKAT